MTHARLQEQIQAFLEAGPWAVVGASHDRAKYGNKVLRCFQQNGRAPLYPIHPSEPEIEGVAAYRDLASTPALARAASIITPPPITERVVEDAIRLRIRQLWMQPGAESARAIEKAEAAGLSVIAGGPCLLVVLGYRE